MSILSGNSDLENKHTTDNILAPFSHWFIVKKSNIKKFDQRFLLTYLINKR